MRILDMGWLFGHRQLTTRGKPVRTPDDMGGLKIRVQPTAIYLETIKAMGGSPTPVDFNELYTSLQTGVVDGQENPPSIVVAAKFFEVQKYSASISATARATYIYGLFCLAQELGTHFLVRSCVDRLAGDGTRTVR